MNNFQAFLQKIKESNPEEYMIITKYIQKLPDNMRKILLGYI
jgi:hypothetical protein